MRLVGCNATLDEDEFQTRLDGHTVEANKDFHDMPMVRLYWLLGSCHGYLGTCEICTTKLETSRGNCCTTTIMNCLDADTSSANRIVIKP